MKILNKFVAIAALAFLLAFVVEQSFSHPTNDEGELRIVKRGILDCPHNCWGSASKSSVKLARIYDNLHFSSQTTLVVDAVIAIVFIVHGMECASAVIVEKAVKKKFMETSVHNKQTTRNLQGVSINNYCAYKY